MSRCNYDLELIVYKKEPHLFLTVSPHCLTEIVQQTLHLQLIYSYLGS